MSENDFRMDGPAERLAEVVELLAAALTRNLGSQSSRLSADFGERSLDIPAHQSGHPTPRKGGGMDE